MAKKIKTILDLQSNKIVNVASGTNPTDAVNFSQLQNAVAGGAEYIGGYNAATNAPNLTAADGSVLKGYMYTVAVAGTFAGQNVEVGDFIISEKDDPAANADFTVVNRNVDPIAAATATTPGIIELATQAEVNGGSDTTRAVTPATLAAYVATQSPATPQATETVAGKAEIATQTETDLGTDDTRMVTPKKLKATLGAQNVTKKFSQTVTLGDAAGNVIINHQLGTKLVMVCVQDASTGEEYEVEVSAKAANTITIAATGASFSADVIVIG